MLGLSNRIHFTDEQAMLLEAADAFCRDKSPMSAVRAQLLTEHGFDRAVWDENMIEVLCPSRAYLPLPDPAFSGPHVRCRARSSSSSTPRTRSATTALRYAPPLPVE